MEHAGYCHVQRRAWAGWKKCTPWCVCVCVCLCVWLVISERQIPSGFISHMAWTIPEVNGGFRALTGAPRSCGIPQRNLGWFNRDPMVIWWFDRISWWCQWWFWTPSQGAWTHWWVICRSLKKVCANRLTDSSLSGETGTQETTWNHHMLVCPLLWATSPLMA